MSGDRSSYRDLVFETQALRRRVERDLRLGGALGIAGDLWPHQVANVARVLCDTAVRHVLADEVGLGKTVQAVMIIKALRLQQPQLRVAVVVPDALQRQWLTEMFVRGNLAVIEGEVPDGDDRRPLLLWPSARGMAEADLASFDMLVVDELPRLTKDLQERIAAASASVKHLLILTATPPLDDPARALQLFQLIEPVRAALAGQDPVRWLRAREQQVAQLLSGGWSEDAALPPPPEPAAPNAALAFGATRRLLRTRREVWSDYLPRREPSVRVIEPTAVERRRQDLLWRWLEFRADLPRDFDAPLMAQRVRSPASLRQRVTFLKGKGYDREGLIEAIGATLEHDPGDTRFEGLLDTLTDIWSQDPEQKVLVAAGDNLTVDDLSKRLPAVFDRMEWSSEPLVVATIRNRGWQEKGPESLADEDKVAAAAASFREGDAQLLLLAVAGSAGLNLQCARHIVLYSVPWDPVEVEQLIGRVDRIGNPATATGSGPPLPVVVHVIAQRGLVDHRVLQVIEATRSLSRSVSVDGDAVERIRGHILDVALKNDPAGWADLMQEARALGASSEIEDLNLPLVEHLPTSPSNAHRLATRLTGAPAAAPAMGDPQRGEAGWSAATLSWLKALRSAGKYTLSYADRGARVRRLAYKLPITKVRSPAELDTRPFGSLPEIKSEVLLRTHRADLELAPPMRLGDAGGPLYFFDHGSPPHEDLILAWLRARGGKKCTLFLRQGDPCLSLAGGVVRVRVAWLDPGQLLPQVDFDHPELEADRRLVRSILPASVIAAAVILRPTAQASLDWRTVCALLAPDPDSERLASAAAEWSAPSWLNAELDRAADAACAIALRDRARERWAPRWDDLRAAISARRYVLDADGADADELFTQRRSVLEAEAAQATAEGRPAAARASAKRLKELASEARRREELEAHRDQWLSAAVDQGPDAGLVDFTGAWLLLKK